MRRVGGNTAHLRRRRRAVRIINGNITYEGGSAANGQGRVSPNGIVTVAGDACNRRNIADERVDYVRRTQQERIAVRCRTHDRFGSDIATRARPVLDDELLAEAFRQPLTHQTCEDVSRAAGVKADDQAHRPLHSRGQRACSRVTSSAFLSVRPKLVGEVKFTEWTRDGEMRHPAFLGLRSHVVSFSYFTF